MTKMLVTVDGSPISRDVLPTAIKIAQATNAHVTLFLVVEPPEATQRDTRFEPPSGPTGDSGADIMPRVITGPRLPPLVENRSQAIARVEAEGREFLADIADKLEEEGVQVDWRVAMGEDAAESIIAFAKSEQFDLIAMATHGRSGLSELVQGSVAAAVVKSGVAPVLLVRPKGEE